MAVLVSLPKTDESRTSIGEVSVVVASEEYGMNVVVASVVGRSVMTGKPAVFWKVIAASVERKVYGRNGTIAVKSGGPDAATTSGDVALAAGELCVGSVPSDEDKRLY